MTTFAQVKAELREIGITISVDRDYGEYRVNFAGGSEATAYYTNDIDDALDTGCAMASYAECRPAAERAALHPAGY